MVNTDVWSRTENKQNKKNICFSVKSQLNELDMLLSSLEALSLFIKKSIIIYGNGVSTWSTT